MSDRLPPVIQSILDNAFEPRWSKQMKLEQHITNFNPDLSEAEDLILAIEASLLRRYDHALLDDSRHYFTALVRALGRAELELQDPYVGSADYHNDDPDRE